MDDQSEQKIKSDDEPLLIVKFQGWRIVWTLFWPFSLGITLFLFIAAKWAFKKSGFMFWFSEIVSITAVVGGLWMIFEMLLVNEFCLYKDRIVQRYRALKKDKQVFWSEAEYGAMTTLLFGNFMIWKPRQRLRCIQFDPTLMSSVDMKAFYELLSQLSGRDIDELKNKTFASKLISR